VKSAGAGCEHEFYWQGGAVFQYGPPGINRRAPYDSGNGEGDGRLVNQADGIRRA